MGGRLGTSLERVRLANRTWVFFFLLTPREEKFPSPRFLRKAKVSVLGSRKIAGTKTSLMVCKAVVFILMQRADFRHFLHRQKTRGIYDKPTSHDQQMFLGHSAFLL